MSEPFPSPTIPADSRAEVFLRYLDFFRTRVTAKIQAMPDAELRSSRLPSGWTPLELVKHLRYVELRWLVWGFEGRDVGDPWGDRDGDGFEFGFGKVAHDSQRSLDSICAELRFRNHGAYVGCSNSAQGFERRFKNRQHYSLMHKRDILSSKRPDTL